ncbi:hypothetical protein TNCV_4175891 [Trichonephila clavipes]|nr:hypothetical protein TNCV_4175891 [Trichonephila clavipes]
MICPLRLSYFTFTSNCSATKISSTDVKSVIRPVSPKWMLSDAIMARQPAEWIFELLVLSDRPTILKGHSAFRKITFKSSSMKAFIEYR